MYLTEELFETADADHPYYSAPKQAMDQHNPQQHSPGHLGKRKRGAAADEYTPNTVPIKNIKISSTHHLIDHSAAPPPPTQVLHATTTTTTATTTTATTTTALDPDPTTLYPSPPRRKHPRVLAHPRRPTHTRPPPHAAKPAHPRTTTTTCPHAPVAPPTTSAVDLTPCHHCGRSPRQKKELESYLSCADCGARTCFICARVCERGRVDGGGCAGGDAERRICCECCVERGEEGETWCLRCVQEGGDGDDDGVGEDMVMG